MSSLIFSENEEMSDLLCLLQMWYMFYGWSNIWVSTGDFGNYDIIILKSPPLNSHADVSSRALVWVFMYLRASCMRAGISLDSLHICAGSPELSLLINVISAGSFVMLKGQNQLKQIVIEVYTHPVFSRKLFMRICFHVSKKKVFNISGLCLLVRFMEKHNKHFDLEKRRLILEWCTLV